MLLYATLAQLQAETETNPETPANETFTADDYKLLDCLRATTAYIDRRTHYSFFPARASYYYDSIGDHIDNMRLLMSLGRPLLSLTSIQQVTTPKPEAVSTVDSNTYNVYPLNVSPAFYLQFFTGSTVVFGINPYLIGYTSNWQQNIKINGVWGYRENYATEAWTSSGDTVQNPGGLNTTATSITVSNANGADALGRLPRFSPGNMLGVTVGDNTEYLSVTSVTGNVLTVQRGMNGTTAITIPQTTTINVFVPQPEITRACVRLAGYMFARRGAFNRRTVNDLGATVEYSPDIPDDVNILLDLFTNKDSEAV